MRYRTGYKCSGMKLPEVYKLYIRPLFKSSILNSYNRSAILEIPLSNHISPPPLYFIIFSHFFTILLFLRFPALFHSLRYLPLYFPSFPRSLPFFTISSSLFYFVSPLSSILYDLFLFIFLRFPALFHSLRSLPLYFPSFLRQF